MVDRQRKKPMRVREKPDLPEIEHLREVRGDQLLAGELLEEIRIANFDASGRKIHSLQAVFAVLEGVSFAGSEIASARFRDVRFVNCDFSNASLRGSQAHRVEFIDCRLTGLKAIEAEWQNVLLENCEARYAQFTDARLRVSECNGGAFAEADFRGCNLEESSFDQVSLIHADFTGSRLWNTCLRGADIDGLIVNAEDVRGAIVSPAQAMELARLLGLVVM